MAAAERDGRLGASAPRGTSSAFISGDARDIAATPAFNGAYSWRNLTGNSSAKPSPAKGCRTAAMSSVRTLTGMLVS